MEIGKVISIFSTKGGVGKSIIGLNTAVCLAKDFEKKTLLIDLDLQGVGDLSSMLDVTPNNTIANYIHLLKKKSDKDSSRKLNIKDFIIQHSCGLDFIPAILRPRQAPHLDLKYLKDFIQEARGLYDYIIIDSGKTFSQSLIASFNNSNLILMVITPDIISVYQTKWALDILQSLQIPLKMMRSILNRSQSLGSVHWEEIKTALPVEIISYVPSQGKVVGLSVNRRIPVVIDSPRALITNAIRDLAERITKEDSLFVDSPEQIGASQKAEELSKLGAFWEQSKLVEPLPETDIPEPEDEVLLLKKRVHERIIDELNLKRLDFTVMDENKAKDLRKKTERAIVNALADEETDLLDSIEVRKHLVKEIADEALGLGPLEDLINDPTVSDILVNGKNQIYIERNGKLELTSKRFTTDAQVRQVIERIIAPLGRRIDESVPMVDARLPDGSRVNAIIPPLSLVGPTLSIRKFGRERYNIDDLINFGTLTPEMRDFLMACVGARRNIIVSGGAGSGKTTLLNVLSTYVPRTERIITIEDAAELKLKQEHWVRLESRAPNIEGRGAIAASQLFRNALRMRPDRILIGECRGAETMDMLQAMNTGHDGSMTTIHANSTRDVLTRLDSMILMSGTELPIRAIREMIASALNIIVHTARLSDGSRKIIQITEITGMLDEIHIGLKDIFVFNQTGVDKDGKVQGTFQATGHIPSFLKDAEVRGITIDKNIFKPAK